LEPEISDPGSRQGVSGRRIKLKGGPPLRQGQHRDQREGRPSRCKSAFSRKIAFTGTAIFAASGDFGRGQNPGCGDRDPNDDRDRTGRGRCPNSLQRTDSLRTGVRSSGRRHRVDESSTRRATGSGFRRDTSTHPPKNSWDRARAGEIEPPVVPAAAQFSLRLIPARSSIQRPTATWQGVSFSYVFSLHGSCQSFRLPTLWVVASHKLIDLRGPDLTAAKIDRTRESIDLLAAKPSAHGKFS